MYFDVTYYRRVLAHVWSLRDWPGRRKTLLRLLVGVPLETLFHALCFNLDYLFFPSLWRLEVRRPVFIIGHARSGTTLTHRLMAQDGNSFSYFLYWEMFFPSLLQKKCIRAFGKLDRAVLGGRINQALVAWDDKTFGPYRHMHNMSLWNAEEDQFVMRAAFVTQQWSLDIPMMDRIDLFHLDDMPSSRRRRWMGFYRQCVKRQLLLNGADKTHLSKNPVMSSWVGALLETFPDARFVVMVREPRQCIPSVLKLVELTWRAKGWRKEQYAASLAALTEVSFDSYHHPARVLAAHPTTPQIMVDYRHITSAPRDTVAGIYRALELPYSENYDSRLRAVEQRERKHESRFEYSVEEYALSTQRMERELAPFYERFGWPTGHTAQENSNDATGRA